MENQSWWEPLPWDYGRKMRDFIRPGVRVLDISPEAEAFPFAPGDPVDVARWTGEAPLPFAAGSFDLVISYHGPYSPEEIARVLKRGGFFVTEQVGGMDAWEPGAPDYNLENEGPKLREAGFRLMWRHQAYPLGAAGKRGHRFMLIGKKQ